MVTTPPPNGFTFGVCAFWGAVGWVLSTPRPHLLSWEKTPKGSDLKGGGGVFEVLGKRGGGVAGVGGGGRCSTAPPDVGIALLCRPPASAAPKFIPNSGVGLRFAAGWGGVGGRGGVMDGEVMGGGRGGPPRTPGALSPSKLTVPRHPGGIPSIAPHPQNFPWGQGHS